MLIDGKDWVAHLIWVDESPLECVSFSILHWIVVNFVELDRFLFN